MQGTNAQRVTAEIPRTPTTHVFLVWARSFTSMSNSAIARASRASTGAASLPFCRYWRPRLALVVTFAAPIPSSLSLSEKIRREGDVVRDRAMVRRAHACCEPGVKKTTIYSSRCSAGGSCELVAAASRLAS